MDLIKYVVENKIVFVKEYSRKTLHTLCSIRENAIDTIDYHLSYEELKSEGWKWSNDGDVFHNFD
jgi:hypothetical protein